MISDSHPLQPGASDDTFGILIIHAYTNLNTYPLSTSEAFYNHYSQIQVGNWGHNIQF